MKEFFKSNIEKVILIAMMLVLAIMAVVVIVSVDLADIELVKLKGSVRLDQVQVELKQAPEFRMGEVSNLFVNDKYIVCRKKVCESIFHDDFKKCPWCGTQVKLGGPTPDDEDDADGDGIPDDKEAEHNMDPNDPADALQDRDGDKFSNYDEIMVGVFGNPTLIDDNTDYPSLLNFAIAKKKSATPLNFIFKAANLGTKDKKSWEIQFLSNRSTRWLTIGAKIFRTDYYLTDVSEENGVVMVTVKKEGSDPVVMKKLKRAFPANSSGVYVYDKRLSKKYFIVDNGIGKLEGPDNQLEEFEFRGFRKSESGNGIKAVLFSRKTNEEFEIDEKKSILNPVK
jgi:hypothetical protein